jgi:hypothetical protein
MRRLSIATGLCLALAASMASSADAAACRDAKGKFITCPPAPMVKKSCRDGKGKFIACASAPVSVPQAQSLQVSPPK